MDVTTETELDYWENAQVFYEVFNKLDVSSLDFKPYTKETLALYLESGRTSPSDLKVSGNKKRLIGRKLWKMQDGLGSGRIILLPNSLITRKGLNSVKVRDAMLTNRVLNIYIWGCSSFQSDRKADESE